VGRLGTKQVVLIIWPNLQASGKKEWVKLYKMDCVQEFWKQKSHLMNIYFEILKETYLERA